MNKLKTIGLSALAGSLAAFSAQAFEASVSGGAEITISHAGGSDVTGNPLGSRKNITFSGSGELDNGVGISVFHAMGDTMAISSSVYAFDLGSLGTIALDSGAGSYGANSIDNVMPTAYEEADYGFTTGMIDIGSTASGAYIGYKKALDVAGVVIGAAYSPSRGAADQGDGGTAEGSGRGYDIFVTAVPMDGLKVGYGRGTLEGAGTTANTDIDESTMFLTYAMGAVTVGYQVASDEDAGGTDHNSVGYGITANLTDDISVGYQHLETEYDALAAASADVTGKFEGVSAAYSMGNMAIKFVKNDATNLGGSTASDDNMSELSLSFAF